MKKNNEINFCEGPIIPKMMQFALPLLFTMIMQSLFHTADLVVVGKYGDAGALASVGATSELTNLILNLFSGLASGVSVCIANRYGAGNRERLEKSVHTSILLSVFSGVAVAVLGVTLARPALTLMGTPGDVLDGAVLYMRIIFAAMPFTMFVSYAAAMLRAVGDAARSSAYMLISGVVNVILNLVFVIGCGWNIAGVAIATAVSNALTAFLLLVYLLRYRGDMRLYPKKLRLDRDETAFIFRNGIPAGLLGMCFSLSGVIAKAGVNSLGVAALGGNTAGNNLQNYVFFIINSISQTAAVFIGQNYGAKNMPRIRRATRISLWMEVIAGVVTGTLFTVFARPLLSIYTNSAEEIRYGLVWTWTVITPYVLYAFHDLFSAVLRGMCRPMITTVVSVAGICGVRLVWIYAVFYRVYPMLLEKGGAELLSLEQRLNAFGLLNLSYVVSWVISETVLVILLLRVFRQTEKQFADPALS